MEKRQGGAADPAAAGRLLSYVLKNSCSFKLGTVWSRYAGDASVEGCLRGDYGKFSKRKGKAVKFAAQL